MKNNLPKYWIVKNDGSNKFKDNVIKYLNKEYNVNFNGTHMNYYYGYDGNSNGCDYWEYITEFKNNPKLLTLDEFIELSKPVENMEEKEIIGYKLLKDLPGLNKGVLSSKTELVNCLKYYIFEYTNNNNNYYNDYYYFTIKELSNTEWFEPIYKEEIKQYKQGDYLYHPVRKILYKIVENNPNFINCTTFPNTENLDIIKNSPYYNRLRKASTEEIQEDLILEARRRGFKKGVTYEILVGDKKRFTLSTNDFHYDDKEDILHDTTFVFYRKGVWGKIIKNELTSIGGYEGKIEEDFIIYGCKDQYKYHRDNISNLITNMLITNMISFEHETGYKITINHLNQILEAFKNK